MVERRSSKISVLIFLFAIFILLVVVTASWIYKIYQEQTAYSEARTLATIECGRYYYDINEESVLYENGTLYFEVGNTLGKDIDEMIVQSSTESKKVDIMLSRGTIQPVSVDIAVAGWVMVYPVGCEGVNFRNISFEPR